MIASQAALQNCTGVLRAHADPAAAVTVSAAPVSVVSDGSPSHKCLLTPDLQLLLQLSPGLVDGDPVLDTVSKAGEAQLGVLDKVVHDLGVEPAVLLNLGRATSSRHTTCGQIRVCSLPTCAVETGCQQLSPCCSNLVVQQETATTMAMYCL